MTAADSDIHSSQLAGSKDAPKVPPAWTAWESVAAPSSRRAAAAAAAAHVQIICFVAPPGGFGAWNDGMSMRWGCWSLYVLLPKGALTKPGGRRITAPISLDCDQASTHLLALCSPASPSYQWCSVWPWERADETGWGGQGVSICD